MNSEFWDQRYAAAELVWSRGPNQFLVREVDGLAPGRALDLACGEGRNAIWLASQGWQATGVDFSPVGIDKARALAGAMSGPASASIAFEVGDATTWTGPGEGFDLVVIFYLHLPADQRRAAHQHAAEAVAPGGTLLIVGHDRDNLEHGVGGPQDASLLLVASEVTDDLDGLGLVIERAEQLTREVEVDGEIHHAIDCLVRAHRPA